MDVQISNNLFLGVAELNRLKTSLGEEGWKRFAKNFVSQFGIVRNTNNTNFIPVAKGGDDETLIIKPGIAFDADMNAIIMDTTLELSLPKAGLSGDNRYWVIVRHRSTHEESGVVSVNSIGALTGVGTKFTEVLRGQPDFPTKIKFNSLTNLGEYEVVKVASDTSAILAGNFTAEQNMRYSVVGTFTPGFIPAAENSQIYTYDSYEIEVLTSVDEPASLRSGYDFVIAVVNYVGNTMNVKDYRMRYLLNEPYEGLSETQRAEAVDGLVTLVRDTVVGLNEKGVLIEFQMQHGFNVTSFELNVGNNGYEITILSGRSNYITAEDTIPDGFFKGWWLLNRNNMQYCEIADSTDKVLSITDLNSDAVQDALNLVLIPPYNEIEYLVQVSNNVPAPSQPYVLRCSLENIDNRIIIPIYWKDVNNSYVDTVTVNFKYRLIGFDKNKYPLNNFNQATYKAEDGVVKSIANSNITINVTNLKPEAEQRNYS